jgi:microcystin degradation protein MlrC
MRVGIIAIQQESNTFLDKPTVLDRFREDLLLTGADVRSALADAHHEVGGFFSGLDETGIEAVGIVAARAMPFGIIAADAFRSLMGILDTALAGAGELDGLLVAPHGAAVSEPEPDFDGFWLSRLRQQLGNQIPIIGTLDPHANLSAKMVAACDALVAYRTNPHLDQRARGLEAATLMTRTLRGELHPVQRACYPPVAINIERQSTTAEPCRGILEAARLGRERPGVLSSSILLGFPYADVAEMGSATLVVADKDADLAQTCADDLGQLLWRRRHELIGQLIDIPAALALATSLTGPVCLLDMGDNVGGGSPADGTSLAQAMLQRALGPTFVCLYDPESVEASRAAGIGGTVRLRAGGKTDDAHGAPLEIEAIVLQLSDGKWTEPEPRHGGFMKFDQGPTAIVQVRDCMTIMLTSRRMAPFSLLQLSSCQIDPAAFRYLIVKGVHAPVAAYESVCSHFIRVNTPGATTADMSALSYRHRRLPMFPFEPDARWSLPPRAGK